MRWGRCCPTVYCLQPSAVWRKHPQCPKPQVDLEIQHRDAHGKATLSPQPEQMSHINRVRTTANPTTLRPSFRPTTPPLLAGVFCGWRSEAHYNPEPPSPQSEPWPHPMHGLTQRGSSTRSRDSRTIGRSSPVALGQRQIRDVRHCRGMASRASISRVVCAKFAITTSRALSSSGVQWSVQFLFRCEAERQQRRRTPIRHGGARVRPLLWI